MQDKAECEENRILRIKNQMQHLKTSQREKYMIRQSSKKSVSPHGSALNSEILSRMS